MVAGGQSTSCANRAHFQLVSKGEIAMPNSQLDHRHSDQDIVLVSRGRGLFIGFLTSLLLAMMTVGGRPANAQPIDEAMPLWRLQVRITTGSSAGAGTRVHPSLRFNNSASGTRALNPRSPTAFDANSVTTYDLRLFGSPSEITMLRVGIAGNDPWCVKKIELLFNGRLAFSRTAPGGGCDTIKAGAPLEYSSAVLRSSGSWTTYGAPPPLPTRMSASDLHALVTGVTGSAMLSATGRTVTWDRAVPLTVVRKTSRSVSVSFGIHVLDPSGVDAPEEARITYDIQLSVGTDGKLHAAKSNPSCCFHFEMSNAVVAQLDMALSRMTARPAPHDPLRFGVDAGTNITWRFTPVVTGMPN
jgi:hypothetical protein